MALAVSGSGVLVGCAGTQPKEFIWDYDYIQERRGLSEAEAQREFQQDESLCQMRAQAATEQAHGGQQNVDVSGGNQATANFGIGYAVGQAFGSQSRARQMFQDQYKNCMKSFGYELEEVRPLDD